MEREAFASLFSQPQRGNKKKGKKASSTASPRKHVNSILERSNKRPRSSAASPSSWSASAPPPSSSSGGSSFVECPLCEKSVHSLLAQSHVERCGGREQDSALQPTASSAGPAFSTAASPNVAAATARGGPLAAAACCVSSSPQAVGGEIDARAVISPGLAGSGPPAAEVSLSQLIEKVAAPRAGTSESDVGRTPAVSAAGTAAVPATAAVSSPCSSTAKPPSPSPAVISAGIGTAASKGHRGGVRRSATNTGTTVNNAFATLMAASALSNFREEMYLWAHEDGTLSWGWGTAGNPLPPPPVAPPAMNGGGEGTGNRSSSSSSSSPAGGTRAAADHRRWSCQVATKGPDGRKAGMCDLWTNLPSAQSTTDTTEAVTAGRLGVGSAPAIRPAATDENAGLKAARPRQSLSRLPVAVIKSMLQKNVRRGRAAAAVRCALELALKSWNDAIRRVLVIIVEDSLLHPAAPLLTWLMVATSKGYRPPHRLLEAFLCVVHETAACPVRESTASSRHRRRCFGSTNGVGDSQGHSYRQQEIQPAAAVNFDSEEFSVPHPQSLLSFSTDGGGVSAGGGSSSAVEEGEAGGAVEKAAAAAAAAAAIAAANIRRALLMRVSYGGMAWDQALLKGVCLAWGERCGHLHFCCCCGTINPCPAPSRSSADTPIASGGAGYDMLLSSSQKQRQPPEPPLYIPKAPQSPGTCTEAVGDRNQRAASSYTATHAGKAAGPARSESSHSNIIGADSTHLPPFGYAHESVLAALQGNGWTAFLAAAHSGTGMPRALRSELLAHVANGTAFGEARGTVAAGAGTEARGASDEEEKRRGAGEMKAGAGARAGAREGAVSTVARTASVPSRRIGPILREADAVLSGVDFHCSGVLDELLRSTAVAAKIGKALLRHRSEQRSGGNSIGSSNSGNSNDDDDDSGEIRRHEAEVISVRQAAKKAMWACSSGLNVRRLRIAFRPDEEGGWSQEEGVCEESKKGDMEQEGARRDEKGSGNFCRCRRCCCSSSPGLLEEIGRAGGAGEDDALLLTPGDGGSGGVCSSSCDDMDARVWAAMLPDVSVWARAFVRGRLARG